MIRDLILVVAALACTFCTASAAMATSPPVEQPVAAPSPGLEIAKHLTLVTGIAISPLMGVSGFGAWQYFTTPDEDRADLPWYANPYFFWPALALVLLLNLKEVFLGFVPPAKKVFDFLEVVENKLSAVVIAAPLVIAMTIQLIETLALEYREPLGLAAVAAPDPTFFLTALALVICVVAFFVVWLAGQAINLLILLSPFGFIDFMLKIIKFALLILLISAAAINPYLGTVISLGILFVAAQIAGWTWRLMVFGTVWGWDTIGRRHRMVDVQAGPIYAFADRRLGRVAVRSFGRIERDDSGRLNFRKWSVIPLRRRHKTLSENRYALSKGLLGPRLVEVEEDGSRGRSVLLLAPRYRTHEEAVARVLGLEYDAASPVPRQVQGAMEWIRDFIRPGSERDAPA